MAANTKIEWAHDTFNPWTGCAKVSPACQHCYAEGFARFPHIGTWGASGARMRTSDANWKKPLAWDRQAEAAGTRRRVFCASLADVFEDRADLDPMRADLWRLIKQTPSLDWLLLTKRPARMASWAAEHGWPENAWAGTTVEDQRRADERIPALLQVPARVRFLSMEPLLGPVDLSGYLSERWQAEESACGCPVGPLDDEASVHMDPNCAPRCRICGYAMGGVPAVPLHWVIAGGESGPNARPMHPEWVRSLRDQCIQADVPFHFKQWGEWAPDCLCGKSGVCRTTPRPAGTYPGGVMFRCGKHRAGRLLDGRAWDEVPR
jgi:protein gp37